MFWIYQSPYSTHVRYCYFAHKKEKRIRGGLFYSEILKTIEIGIRPFKECGSRSKDLKI